MTAYTKGSEWRMWDLQVQTRLDKSYKPLGAQHGLAQADLQKLKDLSGLTEEEITIKETQIPSDRYARLLLAYTQLFTDIKVLGITDHNSGAELDSLISESKNFDIHVIPGVEISSAQGIHMLCFFNPETPWKTSWARTIEDLMTELKCPQPFDNNKQPQICGDTCQVILDKISFHNGLVIFPHITNENGLFKSSATANGGSAHIDIYKHKGCRAVQIPTTGIIKEGTKNVIEGNDDNYGKKKVGQFRCSDSRNLKEIGSGYTWIKANPTFQGLAQAIEEHKERLSLRPKPELLKRIELNSTKIIEEVSIEKKENSDLKEDWFAKISLPFNPGLIAIIGNKGSGKSALADITGLLGNSHQGQYFSFLNISKFKKGKKSKASHFDAKLLWGSKEPQSVNLDEEANRNAIERVKYIPQHYLEKICDNVDSINDSPFEEEIQSVIFSHVDYSEKLGQATLQDLIRVKTKYIDSSCALLREKLSELNIKIIDLETKLSKKSLELLENNIKEKEEQLKAIDSKIPESVDPPDQKQGSQEEAQKHSAKLEALRLEVSNLETIQRDSSQKISELTSELIRIGNLKAEVQAYAARLTEFRSKVSEALKAYSVSAEDIIVVTTDYAKIDSITSKLETSLLEERKKIFDDAGENFLQKNIEVKIEEMRIVEQELDAPNRKYQAYLKEVDNWKKAKTLIEGDVKQVGSLSQLKAERKSLDNLRSTLQELLEQRYMLSTEIFMEIDKLRKEYQKLYAPVQNLMSSIEGSMESKNEIELSFSASIALIDFVATFLNYINKSRTGSFKGAEDGQRKLLEILRTTDFQSANGVREFLGILIKSLTEDSDDSFTARIQEQMNSPTKIKEFYDYMFSLSYLTPKYDLMWSGKKPEELSPGERGCMLLVFYLLLDKRDYPLIIDQPEENLDNQTIFRILVPCVRKAKNYRQIIVVTHNPNIAVNCDADQIICASIDKKRKNKVSYKSGAIEDDSIRDQIINILEGTLPAFVKRKETYRIN